MALDGGEWLISCPSSFIPGTSWRLDGPHRQAGHFVEQKNLLPLLGIEPPDHPQVISGTCSKRTPRMSVYEIL